MKRCNPKTAPARFEALIEKIPFHGCWEWMGTKTKQGYGTFNYETPITAHAAAWKIYGRGEPPKMGSGDHLHHKCFNRGCVNPNHLERISIIENIRHSHPGVKRDTCLRGHRLDLVENLPDGTFKRRRCSVCRAAQRAAVYNERKTVLRARRMAFYYRHKTEINEERRALYRHQKSKGE